MSQKIINCPHCGRVLPKEFWHENQPDKKIVKCPQCGSQKVWKDAFRYVGSRKIQRYYCRECGRRFS